jgi:predicted glycosyltransferase
VIRAERSRAVVADLRPSVTVVDHLPTGAGNELLPALRRVRADGGRAILGLRDVDDHDRLAGSAWRGEGLRVIATLYHAALVYGPPATGDARVRRLRSAGVPVHHVGRIVAEPDGRAPSDLPAEYLLATVGGGIDGFRPLSVLLEALRLRPLGLPTVLVAGPLMPAVELARLRALAAGLDARVEHRRVDMLAVVHGARAVVAMAGYNTVAEVLQAGTPALLVPRATPSTEQLVRALRLRDAGLASVIAPHELEPERLRRALGALLRGDRAQSPDMRGACAAADLILSVAGREPAGNGRAPASAQPAIGSDNGHEEEQERLEGRNGRRFSLSADRREDRGAG